MLPVGNVNRTRKILFCFPESPTFLYHITTTVPTSDEVAEVVCTDTSLLFDAWSWLNGNEDSADDAASSPADE